jgi:hypothetical protein
MKVLKRVVSALLFLIGTIILVGLIKIGLNHHRFTENPFPGGSRESYRQIIFRESGFYGAARETTITPSDVVYLAGFDFNRKSTGVHDNLFAKVLILADGNGNRIAIITLDLLGFMQHDVQILKKELERRGLFYDHQVFVNATHNHSGPDPIGIWGIPYLAESGRDEKYIASVIKVIVDLVEKTLHDLQPVDIYFAETDGQGLSKNLHPSQNIDTEIKVLFVIGKKSGAIATLINFGCHPEAASEDNTLITADFPGVLYKAVSEKLGGITFFINGSLGGLVIPNVKEENFETMEAMGKAVGNKVLESYGTRKKLTLKEISSRKEEVTIPLENKFFWLGFILGIIPGSTLNDGEINTEVNLLKIGELEVITVPGEITPTLGFIIKSMLPEKKMLWSLTNDEIGYILSEKEFVNELYAYERKMSVGSLAGPRIIEAAKKLTAKHRDVLQNLETKYYNYKTWLRQRHLDRSTWVLNWDLQKNAPAELGKGDSFFYTSIFLSALALEGNEAEFTALLSAINRTSYAKGMYPRYWNTFDVSKDPYYQFLLALVYARRAFPENYLVKETLENLIEGIEQNGYYLKNPDGSETTHGGVQAFRAIFATIRGNASPEFYVSLFTLPLSSLALNTARHNYYNNFMYAAQYLIYGETVKGGAARRLLKHSAAIFAKINNNNPYMLMIADIILDKQKYRSRVENILDMFPSNHLPNESDSITNSDVLWQHDPRDWENKNASTIQEFAGVDYLILFQLYRQHYIGGWRTIETAKK